MVRNGLCASGSVKPAPGALQNHHHYYLPNMPGNSQSTKPAFIKLNHRKINSSSNIPVPATLAENSAPSVERSISPTTATKSSHSAELSRTSIVWRRRLLAFGSARAINTNINQLSANNIHKQAYYAAFQLCSTA